MVHICEVTEQDVIESLEALSDARTSLFTIVHKIKSKAVQSNIADTIDTISKAQADIVSGKV